MDAGVLLSKSLSKPLFCQKEYKTMFNKNVFCKIIKLSLHKEAIFPLLCKTQTSRKPRSSLRRDFCQYPRSKTWDSIYDTAHVKRQRRLQKDQERLFVVQGVYRIQLGRLGCRIQSKKHTNEHWEPNAEHTCTHRKMERPTGYVGHDLPKAVA